MNVIVQKCREWFVKLGMHGCVAELDAMIEASKKVDGIAQHLRRKSWRIMDGRVCHDGDCHHWSKRICTCGLIHHLMAMPEESHAFPWYGTEWGQHEWQLHRLPEWEEPPPRTTEDDARSLNIIYDVFGREAMERMIEGDKGAANA